MEDSDWSPDFGQLDATPPSWAPKRPVRIAVLGDFSAGAAAGRLETGADLARRKLISVEFDNLEDTLARQGLKLSLPLGSAGEGIELEFPDLDAFHPDALYANLSVFKALGDLRKKLNNTATFAKAAKEVQSWAGGAKRRASKTGQRRSRGAAPAADARLSDFARLVGIEPGLRIDGPIDALLRQIVGPFVQPAPDPKRDALVATVDRALSDAMRAVLHQAEFQNLESLWRGMDMLLRRVETGPSVQVFLVDVSAEEFAADLSAASDLAETGLYSMLADKPSHEKNGGLSLICGLYQFEATPPHTELLGRIAKIAAHAGAPFVTAMACDAFTDRKKAPHPLVAQAMRELRALPQASHLALLAPRFMLRHPYGKRADPISVFDFEEFTAAEGLSGMLWGHPAIVAACVLAAPVGQTLSIGDLPFHFVVDGDGDQVALPCTERLINADTATRLRSFGIAALMAHKGQPELRLAGLDAVNGSPLALQGMPKPAARSSITTQVQGKLAGRPEPGAKAAEPEDADASASESTDEASADSTESGDGGMDDLLASMGGDDSAASTASEETSDDSPAADAEPEMDPELAALMKSLE